jgi:putative addiction module component (TIGR02574 family)
MVEKGLGRRIIVQTLQLQGTYDRNRPMKSTTRQVEAKALKLPPRERARLAERLISSLDDQVDLDSDELWAEEAERRLEELRSGAVKSRSAENVFRKARSTLR